MNNQLRDQTVLPSGVD